MFDGKSIVDIGINTSVHRAVYGFGEGIVLETVCIASASILFKVFITLMGTAFCLSV